MTAFMVAFLRQYSFLCELVALTVESGTGHDGMESVTRTTDFCSAYLGFWVLLLWPFLCYCRLCCCCCPVLALLKPLHGDHVNIRDAFEKSLFCVRCLYAIFIMYDAHAPHKHRTLCIAL